LNQPEADSGVRCQISGKNREEDPLRIGDVAVEDPEGEPVVLGDVITVPTIVVISRYFG
jgi:hypothetical protein